MKFDLKTILLTSLISVSSTNATFNLGNHTDDSLLMLVMAAKHYPADQLSETTIKICQEVEKQLPAGPRKKKVTLSEASKNGIRQALASLPATVKQEMYKALSKQDKMVAIEGLVMLYLDVNEDLNLKAYVDRLLYIIFSGNTFDAVIQDALMNKQAEVKYIQDFKMGWMPGLNLVLARKALTEKLTSIWDVLPEESRNEILAAVEKGKSHFLNGTNLKALEDKITAITITRMKKN